MASKDARSKKHVEEVDEIKDQEVLEEAVQTIRNSMADLAELLKKEKPYGILYGEPKVSAKPAVRLENYYGQLCGVGRMLKDASDACGAIADQTIKLQAAIRGQPPSCPLGGHFGIAYNGMHEWHGHLLKLNTDIEEKMNTLVPQYSKLHLARKEAVKRAKAKKAQEAKDAAKSAEVALEKKKKKQQPKEK